MESDWPVPGGSRSKALLESLREDGEDLGWHVPVLVGSDHFLDRLDLAGCQLLRRDTRTGGQIVQTTLLVPFSRIISGV